MRCGPCTSSADRAYPGPRRQPIHGEDSAPSLHVYPDPYDGWYCFDCGRGGSIFDLGAQIYGLSTRGRDFVGLRRRLRDTL
jgi:hypothetical protein